MKIIVWQLVNIEAFAKTNIKLDNYIKRQLDKQASAFGSAHEQFT